MLDVDANAENLDKASYRYLDESRTGDLGLFLDLVVACAARNLGSVSIRYNEPARFAREKHAQSIARYDAYGVASESDANGALAFETTSTGGQTPQIAAREGTQTRSQRLKRRLRRAPAPLRRHARSSSTSKVFEYLHP